MGYIMEARAEAARLEEQNRQGHYRIETELEGIGFDPAERVLDAGCGTGLVARYLVDELGVRHVEGIDASELRIRQAKELAGSRTGYQIHFAVQDLSRLDPAYHGRFDTIICRYVIEHVESAERVLRELTKALRPGGRLIIIEMDGVFVNLSSANPEFNSLLEEFESKVRFDLHVGRKVPQLFATVGLKDIEWKATLLPFQGDALEEEAVNTERRFAALGAFLTGLFGTVERAERFRSLYMQELRKPENTLVFTKYVCVGRTK